MQTYKELSNDIMLSRIVTPDHGLIQAQQYYSSKIQLSYCLNQFLTANVNIMIMLHYIVK